MSKKVQAWVEAAKIFAENPKARVKCPECNVGELMVEDVIVKEYNKMDRYIKCNSCGKWNVLTRSINIPPLS